MELKLLQATKAWQSCGWSPEGRLSEAGEPIHAGEAVLGG